MLVQGSCLPKSYAPFGPHPGEQLVRGSEDRVEKVLDRQIRAFLALISSEGAPVEETFFHQPVLLPETVEYLAVRPGGAYIDCTVGEGGHASGILEAASPSGSLLGLDLDPDVLERARRRLQSFEGAATLVQGSYAQLSDVAKALGFPEADGILMDLGLSSYQLESAGRGFSFRRDEPLDMRFDPKATLTADRIVNEYSSEKLADVLFHCGEEPRARAIAAAMVRSRPLRSTGQLAALVATVSGGRRSRINPATRTFQALRIAVNGELDNLRVGLHEAIGLLKPGGRLAVISYHSLEDRIVKQTIAREARTCICPPRTPVCTCGHVRTIGVISKRVIKPAAEEIRHNPRSRSARMRVAERM